MLMAFNPVADLYVNRSRRFLQSSAISNSNRRNNAWTQFSETDRHRIGRRPENPKAHGVHIQSDISEISKTIANLDAFKQFSAAFQAAFISAYTQSNEGSFDGHNWLRNDHPDLASNIGIAAVMSGYQDLQVDVSVSGIDFTFRNEFLDHFGAGVEDSGRVDYPGVPNIYFIQHFYGSSTQYAPFIWSTSVITTQ